MSTWLCVHTHTYIHTHIHAHTHITSTRYICKSCTVSEINYCVIQDHHLICTWCQWPLPKTTPTSAIWSFQPPCPACICLNTSTSRMMRTLHPGVKPWEGGDCSEMPWTFSPGQHNEDSHSQEVRAWEQSRRHVVNCYVCNG